MERCCSGPEPELEPELVPKPVEEPSLAGPALFVPTPSLKRHSKHSLEETLRYLNHLLAKYRYILDLDCRFVDSTDHLHKKTRHHP